MIVVSSGATGITFFGNHHLGAIQLTVEHIDLRTLSPWKRRSERVVEVKQHPSDHHVVVTTDENANHCGCNSHPSKIGTHCAPHIDGSLAKPLPDAQLQVEDWDAFEDKHDEIRNQKGS